MSTAWDSRFETKIYDIDSQHKRLFALLSNLEAVFQENPNNLLSKIDEIKEAINALEDYTLSHFLIEERVMEKNNYPEIEKHKLQHDAFTDKIFEMKKKFAGDTVSHSEAELHKFLENLISFLGDWLINHILKQDMDYKPYIKYSL